jgi:hypothetical protein
VNWARYSARADEETSTIDVTHLPASLSGRVAVLLAARADQGSRDQIFKRYFASSQETERATLEFIQQQAMDGQRFGTPDWDPNLKAIRRCFEAGSVFPMLRPHSHSRASYGDMVPMNLASTIMDAADKYPGVFVRAAEERCRTEVAKTILPVMRIAERDRWFL